MSRQQWAATMGEVDAPETDWRELVKHKPLKDQTTDPGAAAFDEAVTLFRSGLKRARQGKIELAVPLIACAYLLDARAVQFVSLLPDRDRENASYYFMDMNLLQDLIDHEGGNNFASQVLMIYAAVRFGHISNRAGQTRIAQALTVSDRLIKTIHADPSIENQVRGVLGGCLKRTTLHRMRCSLYVSLGNRKKAIQELAAALNIDPSLASVRCARACLYSSLEEKDTEVAAQEFRQTVTDAHPDSSELPIAYAWMAKLLLENNKLGNYDQAETYWKKSRQAAVRYKELYGETSKSVIEDEMQDFFATVDPPAQSFESREEELLGSFEDDRACFACGCTTNRVGGNLFQCSQCKQAYYCSTECQQHVSERFGSCTFLAVAEFAHKCSF
jgi:tetratricopeptide (TPR) repeat protein